MDYLPDVNVVGGYANQTFANYIQNNFNYVGVTATYTFWEWGKKHDVELQRQTDLSLARQNLQVTRDKVELAARKSFGASTRHWRAIAWPATWCKHAKRPKRLPTHLPL